MPSRSNCPLAVREGIDFFCVPKLDLPVCKNRFNFCRSLNLLQTSKPAIASSLLFENYVEHRDLVSQQTVFVYLSNWIYLHLFTIFTNDARIKLPMLFAVNNTKYLSAWVFS